MHSTWDAALVSPHEVLGAARAWLALGDLLDDTIGYAAYKHGLDELGDAYNDQRGFDDTGGLVHIAEEASDPGLAKRTLRDALDSRIARYLRRYRDAIR